MATSEASSTATSTTGEESSITTSTEAESSGAFQTGNAASSASSQEPTSSSSAAAAESSSDSDSGPSAGLIAGVVVGAIAALALIGIFVLLLLRHRKKNQTTSFTDKEASPTIASSSSSSSSSDQPPPANGAYHNVPQQHAYPSMATIPTSTNAPSSRPATMLSPVSPITPRGQSSSLTFVGGAGVASADAGAGAAVDAADHSPSSHLPRYSEDNRYSDEKPPQCHQFMDPKLPESNEMPTNANVWEIGGREIPHPSELDAGRRDGLNLGDIRQQQGNGYASYRPLSIQDGQQDGEFLDNRPVGQAL